MMSLWSSVKNFLYPDEEYLEEEELEEGTYDTPPQASGPAPSASEPSSTRRDVRNVVPFQSQGNRRASKIFVMEPSVYAEAERIADAMLRGEAVIVNFKRMDKAEAKRMIDFAVGVAYAINGDVQKIRDEIFICSPVNIQVQGNFDEEAIELFRRSEETY